MLFIVNRKEAGQQLAKALNEYKDDDAIVYALPRGGVVLGFEVAKELHLPLDIIVTRKIGHPNNPERAVCAVTEKGMMYCNKLEKIFIDPKWLERQVQKEKEEVLQRKKLYLGKKTHIPAKDKIAIIVDDGIATGITMFAAIRLLKKEKPKKIIVAVPVAPYEVVVKLKKEIDEVVVLEGTSHYLGAVSEYYRDFPQLSDQEVVVLLQKADTKQVIKD